MKLRAAHLFLFLALLSVLMLAGCASTESDNASVRPWNSPQGWENGLGGMDNMQQHR